MRASGENRGKPWKTAGGGVDGLPPEEYSAKGIGCGRMDNDTRPQSSAKAT